MAEDWCQCIRKLNEARATFTDGRRSNEWVYQTDKFGLLLASSKPEANESEGIAGRHVWKWVREEHGLVDKSIEPAGGGGVVALGELTTDYDYDDRGNLIKVEYAQSKLGGTEKISEEWVYDPDFNVATKYTDEVGRIGDYVLDSRGNVVFAVQRDINGDAGGDRVIAKTFTPAPSTIGSLPGGMQQTETEGLGLHNNGTTPQLSWGLNDFDSTQQVTHVTDYYESGASIGLVRASTFAAGSSVESSVQYVYDSYRHLSTSTEVISNASDRTTTYRHDRLGQLVAQIAPAPGVLSLPTVNFLFYDAAGNVRFQLDESQSFDYLLAGSPDLLSGKSSFQNVKESRYDNLGRLASTILPNPGGSIDTSQTRAETQYVYDDANNLEYQILVNVNQPDPQIGTTADRITRNVYDNRNQLITSVGANPGRNYNSGFLPSGQQNQSVVRSTYDALGNLATVSDGRYADSANAQTKFEYDALNRLVKTTSPTPTGASSTPVSTAVYFDDGQLKSTSTPGPNGNTLTKTNTYDGFGRRVSEQNPDGITASIEYDRRDNIKVVKRNQVAQAVNWYDDLNRLIATDSINPDAVSYGVSTYTVYNEAGDVLETLDFAGDVNLAHLADNRITSSEIAAMQSAVWARARAGGGESLAAQDSSARKTQHFYDNQGRIYKTLSPGKSKQDGENLVSTDFAYDPRGLVLSRVISYVDDQGAIQTYQTDTKYDNFGRMWYSAGLTNDSGERVERILIYNVDGTLREERTSSPNDVSSDQNRIKRP